MEWKHNVRLGSRERLPWTSLENTSVFITGYVVIILITTNDVKSHIQRHVLSSNLEQNDTQKQLFQIWVATFKFLSNLRATFG